MSRLGRSEVTRARSSADVGVVVIELRAVQLIDAGELVDGDVKAALARRGRRLRRRVVAKGRRAELKRATGLRGKHSGVLDSLFPSQSNHWAMGQIRRCTATEYSVFPAEDRYVIQRKRPPGGVNGLTQRAERVVGATQNARVGRKSDNPTPTCLAEIRGSAPSGFGEAQFLWVPCPRKHARRAAYSCRARLAGRRSRGRARGEWDVSASIAPAPARHRARACRRRGWR